MSIPLLNAIYAACAGSALFQSALAKDPNLPSAPAIFLAHANFDATVFDCLTYAASMSKPDARFDSPIQGGASDPVERVRVDFAYYMAGDDTAPIEAALGSSGELDQLFRFAPQLALVDGAGNPAGTVFKTFCLTRQTNLYDDKLRKLFGLASYQFIVQFPSVNA